MGKPKHKECMGCMDAIWIENNRYYHCMLCDVYYAGQTQNLYLVENPYLWKEIIFHTEGNAAIFDEEVRVTDSDEMIYHYGLSGLPSKIYIKRRLQSEKFN